MQDLHIHTIFSDGQVSVEDICSKANEYGIEIGISDHILCKGMRTKESVLSYLEYLARYPVLKGGEIDLGETGIINDKIVSNIDYIIGSIHSVNIGNQIVKLGKYFDYRDKRKILSDKYLFDDYVCSKALETILSILNDELSDNPIDILGHCTVNPFYEQVNAKFKYEWENEVIEICKKNNVAIEISGLWIEPSIDFIRRVINNNVKVTFGSDCHTKYDSSYFDYYNYIKNILNLKEGDVLKVVK